MRRIKLLFEILTAVSVLLPTFLFSQVDTAWVRRLNGPSNGPDVGNAIAVDSLGNVYIAGYVYYSSSYKDYSQLNIIRRERSNGLHDTVDQEVMMMKLQQSHLTGPEMFM